MHSGASKTNDILESAHDGKLNRILQRSKNQSRTKCLWSFLGKYLGKKEKITRQAGRTIGPEISLTLNRGQNERRFGGNIPDFIVIYKLF